jgi:peroxiredoxin
VGPADFHGRVVRRVPGAFTSTCHNAHIPQFVANAAAFKAKGVDRIVVMAVNDHHVMKVWGEALGGAGRIDFVADGEGKYARAIGLEVDIPGLGKRATAHAKMVKTKAVPKRIKAGPKKRPK